jgi:diguanylate cyclase (GGDEF)-like protein
MDRLTRISERYSNPLSVAVIDLDHFKSVNDEHGHPAGDAVLVGFARLLAGAFRGEDVVARWGGEEFFVGLYGAPRDQAAGRLEQVLKQLQALPFQGRDRSFTASFSAGVAEYPSDGDDLHTLYQAADQALYRAKEAGRARVCTSTSE